MSDHQWRETCDQEQRTHDHALVKLVSLMHMAPQGVCGLTQIFDKILVFYGYRSDISED